MDKISIKNTWIRNSHRVQEMNHWKNSESQTNAYTGKASFTELKNGKQYHKGQCLNINKDETIGSLIKCCNANNILFKFSDGKYKYVIPIINLIVSLLGLLVLFGFLKKEYSVIIGIGWLIIPVHTLLVLNKSIARRIWGRSMIPWVQLYLSILETWALCDICNWDIRLFIIGPPVMLSQMTIINLDGVYFDYKHKHITILHIIIGLFWRFSVLYGIRFGGFAELRFRNLVLLSIEPARFSLNNISLYVSKTSSMILFLCGQIYFKCRHPDQAYALKTHYTIRKNSEWNSINRQNRIVKRESLKTDLNKITSMFEIQV